MIKTDYSVNLKCTHLYLNTHINKHTETQINGAAAAAEDREGGSLSQLANCCSIIMIIIIKPQ